MILPERCGAIRALDYNKLYVGFSEPIECPRAHFFLSVKPRSNPKAKMFDPQQDRFNWL
jgi:hypothetical protein